jgi:hypothetical protein
MTQHGIEKGSSKTGVLALISSEKEEGELATRIAKAN